MSDSPAATLPPIRIFFSYVRADDESFTIVRPLKQLLGQLITALSGQPAEIFIDRDDIPLGTNWREKIESAVRQAYFFIPIYTGSYPQSEACRDEFFLFQEAASQLEASKLIIPVAWFGLSTLRPEGEDEISDYIRSHQTVFFEEAWIQGIDSAPYKASVFRIAQRILEVSPAVDEALANAEELEAAISIASEPGESEVESVQNKPRETTPDIRDESDNDGLFELATKFTDEVSILTETAEALGSSLSELGELPPPPQNTNLSPNAASRYMIQIAATMKQPSLDIEENGQKMFQAAKRSDGIFRQIVRTTLRSESPDLIKNVYSSLHESVESLETTKTVADQLEQLLTSLKAPEALSASIRRSIKPARQGILAVQDSIRLVSEWPVVLDSLLEPTNSK